ncbi:PP2C family serine/threonine-protein phosphatase [Cyberlindnera jadinii NRRL Y-1542]|uniref:protein-serine/threonine phosphatase n=1 Tax=Cyberlindnera jadinii (strain ATCC 18201 / CBS 1600 / BCRC 20928 / JCM 3617 / NBRC 0987 / NRRL Y-1542) TaxID=983966 RepID=A0A1E4S8H2_CYBJN|nr:PP2C-domain-containing protein [Cyberlindnera jadinii NRRL Y-1542]ODV75815.1 PP2C-domain-containing protein [Cyberlindnera jadinii NRRL Y-1542]
MGQILSQPVTEKHSFSDKDAQYAFGLSSMQGWRINMEDAHTTVLDMDAVKEGDDGEASKGKESVAFFGVFDGHGGDKIAQFTGENLHKILKRQEEFKKGNYSQALKDSFLAADVEILKDFNLKNDQSGCTATTVIISKDKIYCANAGDSRTVLSVAGESKPLSFDHKPNNEGEHARICAAGGFVDIGRVNGNLALSRAIGDFDFKKSADLPPEEQIVTAYPDVLEHQITEKDEFIILACDGIWDCLTSQQAVEVVRKGINDHLSLEEICEAMIDICLAPNSYGSGIGCDNMSVIIVALLQGKTLDEWYQSVIDNKGPISQPFEEVAKEIYSEDQEQQAADQEAQAASEDTEGDGSKTSFSIQQLLEQSILTNQNGVFYLDSGNLMNSLGVPQSTLEEDENEGEQAAPGAGEEEKQKITEVDEESK